MDERKVVTLSYGVWDSWPAFEEEIPGYLKSAEYLRQIALRPGSGYTEEEANRAFTLRILKDGEFVPIKQSK